MSDLSAVALSCTLKPSPTPSSTDKLCHELLVELARWDLGGELIRVVDHDVKPGVTSDEGDGDAWPGLWAKVMDADILVLGTPIWLGSSSSVCRRVLERLDGLLGETDDEGRLVSFGHVAVVATVGNEDGAHAVGAQLFQALTDVGFTVPTNGQTYWVGEARGAKDYIDLDETPESLASTTATVARHAAHLARLLKENPYPPAPEEE